MACESELDKSGHHPHPGRGKTVVPVQIFPQQTAHQRSEGGSEVDPQVKQRETRITPRPALGIKLTDQCADVGLQQAGAQYHQQQSGKEGSHPRNSEGEVSGGNETPARPDCPLPAQQAVSNPAARQSREINRRGV